MVSELHFCRLYKVNLYKLWSFLLHDFIAVINYQFPKHIYARYVIIRNISFNLM
jgi:hypothetical protein